VHQSKQSDSIESPLPVRVSFPDSGERMLSVPVVQRIGDFEPFRVFRARRRT